MRVLPQLAGRYSPTARRRTGKASFHLAPPLTGDLAWMLATNGQHPRFSVCIEAAEQTVCSQYEQLSLPHGSGG